MSLKTFHFVFILASITLSAWISAWGLREYMDSGEQMPLMLGTVGLAMGLCLVGYLNWFAKKLKRSGVLALALPFLVLSTPGFSCSVCIGDANSPLVQASAKGIWLLLGITGAILSSFAGIFVYWGLKARRLSR